STLLDQHRAERASGHQAAAQPRPLQQRQWGSREVEITQVRFLDAQGREQCQFATGDAMVIEVTYQVHERPPPLALGIVFSPGQPLPAGVAPVVLGVLNTDLTREGAETVEPGCGRIYCRILALPFCAGSYRLDVAVRSRSGD